MNKANQNQSRNIQILLGLYLTLLVNSAVLFALDFNQFFSAYRGTLLFHIFGGLVIGLPLLRFLFFHLKTMPHRANLPTALLGMGTTAAILTTIGTGLLLYDENLAAQKTIILGVHLGSVVATLFCFYGHLRLRRKAQFHFYTPPTTRNISRQGFAQHPFSKTLLFSHVLFALLVLMALPIEQNGEPIEPKNFQPAQATINGEHYLHPSALDNSESCGEAGCHPDIFTQWNESAHHFSSFNNPWYQKSIEVILAEKEPEKMRWCASCHDPMLLLTGDLEKVETDFFKNHPRAEKGITCLSCHAIQEVTDIRGNGNFVIQDAGYAALSNAFFLQENSELRRFFIQTKSEPHAASLMNPVLNTDEFCASCHKVSVPVAVNNYRWKRGQNHYDDWYSSSFSGKHPRAFYDREPENCVSCHMPKVPSNDSGNDGGMVKSHRFMAANTALPFVNQHSKQLAATVDYLQNDIAELDIFSIKINGKQQLPTASLPVFKKGDKVELEVVVRNKNVGHQLPSGTNDSNEWWLQVQLLTANNKPILSSGMVDETGEVAEDAHFFKAILIDKNGNLIDKRNVHDWYATVYNSAIPSGLSRLVRYQFTVPNEEISHIEVAMQQRKFNRFYNQFTFAGELEKTAFSDSLQAVKKWILNDTPVPEIPITTVTETQRLIGENYLSNTPLWQRWNNYGIGLMNEENYREATAAFQKVTELAPEKADGWLNQSRVLLAEGALAKAEEMLNLLLERFPENRKIPYFLGQVYFEEGRFAKALFYWEKVIATYPNDEVLLSDLGQLHYLQNEYETAENYLQRALKINLENAAVIYRMMLLYGAMDKAEKATEFQQLYKKYKKNEAEEEAIAAYKKQHSVVNNETQVVHYHGLE